MANLMAGSTPRAKALFVTLILTAVPSLLLLAASSPVFASEQAAGPQAAFAPCTIGDGRARVVAECTTISVPLDHDRPDGKILELSIARIAARKQTSSRTAFTLLAGGPGQSAIDSYAALAFAFRHIGRDQDIVLVDQRGTGSSHRLECPEQPDAPDLSARPASELSDDELSSLANRCREGFDVDPRHFTTSAAVRDLDVVREQLGLTQWHLYGVSYGTRVAQHYTRRYPDHVASMILDAVIPPDIPLGPDVAALADRSLALLFERCANEPDCAERFPAIDTRTREWFATLSATPLSVEIEDIVSGGERQARFGARELANVLRLMSYNAMTAALLPSMLDAAINDGHIAPLARQAELQARSLGDTIASGMYHAIVCTEDVPRIQPDAAEASIDTMLGPALLNSLLATCRDWPGGNLDADFHEPLVSGVPTLILSGEADPITPPDYGERVAASLGDARHLILPAQGHMQAPLGCIPATMAQFIVNAEDALRVADDSTLATSLDTSCVERIVPPPFFIDPNGPTP